MSEEKDIKTTEYQGYDSLEELLADFKTAAVPIPAENELYEDMTLAAFKPVNPDPAEVSAKIDKLAAVKEEELPLEDQTPEATAPEEEPEEALPEQEATPEIEWVEEPSPEDKEKEKRRKKAEKKKKKRRKKRHRSPLLGWLIFFAICGGLFLFAKSSFFTVTEIDVQGNKYYTPSQIKELSQIKTGYNLFFETPIDDARALLLADPYIKNVEIKKVPINKIEIIVTERVEYAAVPYGEQYVLIDSDGMVLRIADEQPAIPLLVGMNIIEMTPGKPLNVEQSYLLVDTLELLGVMSENDLYFKQVNFSTVVVKAYIYDELFCEGTPENITNSMSGIKQLVSELYTEGIDKGIIKVGKNNYLSFDPQIE